MVFVTIDASVDGRPAAIYRNVTAAMAPTLLIGDRFTVVSLRGDKGSSLPVRRGDLVVHRWPPDTTKRFVKRIVGVPGDTLAMADGVLFRGGRKVSESYAWHEEPGVDPVASDFDWQRAYVIGSAARDTNAYRPSRNNWGPLRLPADAYFVLGDNRDGSFDSRYWGFLSPSDIVALPRRVYFSRDVTTGAIRWKRFGRRLH